MTKQQFIDLCVINNIIKHGQDESNNDPMYLEHLSEVYDSFEPHELKETEFRLNQALPF